ncbi:hypothetical protein ACFWVB_20110 [Streptomyces microflavus]|uniref:hypothetical protein n=1 Tax=Streptomyces microflavus TaxID=1919 RepID=UPI00365560EF
MPLQPLPNCGTGGAGADAVDVEQIVLCDLDAEGNLLGTALAVYEYDSEGAPTGAPTFVDPATGEPYVPQGTLQPCPDAACLPPMQFCQTSTDTGPVEHPGRQYDITLPINQGFAVDSLTVDAVTHPAGITWSIFDVDGDTFAADLESFIQGRVPAGATVTVNNPNSGADEICGAALPMTIHIECVRLDQSPPNLIELVYNGGEDLVQNPGYNTTPPTDLSQFQFYYLQRQDAGGTVNCTSVANRGWETNDLGPNGTRDFEVWGTGPGGLAAIQNTTPTPRGTPVQEVTADINDTGSGPTIWQTFNVPAPGNFRVQLVHGARDPGETHTIRLSTGDTNDTGPGDIINDVTNPASVTNSGGPNPWTVLDQTVPLNSGEYTFSFTTTTPVGPNRGGLFTDMRVYVDRPGLRATAATDDDTCVVLVDETSTNTICSYWQPQCAGGAVVGWQKVDTGETMTNAEFWAQVPTPGCCLPEAGEGGGGGGVRSNMLTSDLVCATVGGIQQSAIRVLVTDPSGGALQVLFLGTNGAPIAPDTWTAGPCTGSRFMADQVLCDDNGPFLRKYVQSLDATNQAQVNSFRDFTLTGAGYATVGTVGTCAPEECRDSATVLVCDVPTDGTLDVEPDIADGVPTDVGQPQFTPLAGPYTALWNGGSLVYPAGAGPAQQHAMAVGQLTASPAGCDDATGTLTVSVRVTQNGPGTGQLWDGALRLFKGTTLTAFEDVTYYAPPGHVQTLSASMPVTAAELASGTLRLGLILETFHGTPKSWTADQFSATVELAGCESTASVQFLRTLVTDCETGEIISTTDTTLDGDPYTVTGNVGQCQPTTDAECCPTSQSVILCDVGEDGTVTQFLRQLTYMPGSVTPTAADFALDGTTPYVLTGTVQVCEADFADREGICYTLTSTGTTVHAGWARHQDSIPNTPVTPNGIAFFDALGNFLDPTADGFEIVPCGATGGAGVDSESFILCDSAGTPNRFIRTYTYGPTGAVAGFTDTTLAGAPFVPTGAVGVCAQTVQADTDFVEEVLCDQNGTAFIRLFRFNSVTGVLVSTVNTTLAGAAFAPVGTVGICSDCCPQVLADDLCTNTGSGRATAIRNNAGTVTLIDSVTGATITNANIVACVDDDTVRVLTAQARTLTNATPWTPGADVAGTLTSLTVTGISGLWDLVDANGTALTGLPAGLTLTWNAEDDNQLTGPTSVTPQAGATVIANWTQR